MRLRAPLSRVTALKCGLLLAVWFVTPGARAAVAPLVCKPAALLSTAQITAPAPPADSRGFDVLSYDLELKLDPAASRITGRMVMVYRALASLSLVRLDLVPELAVSAVADSLGELTFVHTDESLAVTLRTPLDPGARSTLTVTWSGHPPRHGSFAAGLMFRHHDAGTRDDPTDDVPIIANVSETWSAHSWWPCKDHPADKALVSLAATVPDSLSLISNGELLSVTEPEAGWRRFAWRENYPLPTYLVSVAATDYSSWHEDCQPAVGPAVRLDYHLFPADRTNAEYDLAHSCQMMSFMTELLGPWPYPGEKYAQAEIKWIGGMEHTTATSLAQLLFTGDRQFETIFLHELSHQWFGDSLTPAVWADIWLNEGFARYSEALWLEHTAGITAYNDFMHLIGPGNHPDFFLGEGILRDPDPILPNLLIYDKGAWVLHMLRGLIGDDTFFQFLHDYATDPELVHNLVTVDQMIAVAERTAGRSLQAFFEPWLTTDLVPIIGQQVTNLPDGQVLVVLSQYQQPIFQLPVPLVLHTACGEIRVTARLETAVQNFVWTTACPVDSVSLAPEGMALLRQLDSPPPQLAVSGPVPNPAPADGADFMLSLAIGSQLVVNTYDASGRKLATASLGYLSASDPEASLAADGHAWHWNGLDRSGHPVPAGLYFLEFKSRYARQVRRVIKLH